MLIFAYSSLSVNSFVASSTINSLSVPTIFTVPAVTASGLSVSLLNTNTGFYVLEPEFISEIPDNTFIHITDIIQKCIEKGERVGAYSISDDCWLDMGQMEEMEKMKKRLGIKDKY